MGRSPRRPGARNIHGILLLDKPAATSSNAALQRVRKLLNARKAGHTGSLDVLATGLLPLCFGEATKVSSYLLDSDKAYEATFRLGAETDTGDAEGRITVTVSTAGLDEMRVRDAMRDLTGRILQVPPMHSALKKDGRPLYELARRGIEVDRPAREVRIDAFEFLGLRGEDLEVRVRCSKGTYIRTLAVDLGKALGCGAHVTRLRRTAAGPFRIGDAVSVQTVEARVDAGDAEALLLPMDAALDGYPEVALDDRASADIRQGRPVLVPAPGGEVVRLYGPRREFLGLGISGPDGRIAPKRLVMASERA